MVSEVDKLKKDLKNAGLSNRAIDAAWPTWWSDEAEGSRSALVELRFSLSRKLGLSPQSLFHDEVRFVWRDEARFKHLSNEGVAQRAAIASFGTAIGRLLLHATVGKDLPELTALSLRNSILRQNEYVDLRSLLAVCWGLGVPTIHLRVFPLSAKRMHAMVVRTDGRFAVLLGRNAQYPAPITFALAHELGHVVCGHLANALALIDVGDPAIAAVLDEEESQANRFALTLLTGSAEPKIETSLNEFNAPTLAAAVLEAGPKERIEPGTLALCHAFQTNSWNRANSALKFIYAEPKPVWKEVNGIASTQLEWDALGEDSSIYLSNVMGIANEQ